MRNLTSEQKSMLDTLIKKHPKAFHVEELPKEDVSRIASMNDNELVWQQMDRYIMEQWFERVYG